MNDPSDRSRVRIVGLFLVLVILVNGLIIPGSTPKELVATFYLALFFHIGFTIYDGSFSSLHTATWLLLIGTWVAPVAVGFSGFMLPWGQFTFWLATLPLVGDALAAWQASNLASALGTYVPWPALPLLILGLDIAVMHHEEWRRSSLLRIAIFLVSVAAAAIILGLAFSMVVIEPRAPNGPDIGLSPFPIMPDWHELPFYALLRAVPNKLGGVALMFACMLAPMVWPWMRVDILRRGPARRVWPLLCLALAAAFVGLGYLGSRPADDMTIRATQALAAFYLSFFLVLPLLIGKIAGRPKA